MNRIATKTPGATTAPTPASEEVARVRKVEPRMTVCLPVRLSVRPSACLSVRLSAQTLLAPTPPRCAGPGAGPGAHLQWCAGAHLRANASSGGSTRRGCLVEHGIDRHQRCPVQHASRNRCLRDEHRGFADHRRDRHQRCRDGQHRPTLQAAP